MRLLTSPQGFGWWTGSIPMRIAHGCKHDVAADPRAGVTVDLVAQWPVPDGPQEAGDLEVAVVGLVVQVGGEVGDVLDVAPQRWVESDVGEAALHARRPEEVLAHGKRHPSSRLPLIDPAIGPLEVDQAGPVGAVHEHRVLLAETKIAKIDERVSQPQRVAAPSGGLCVAVEEVAFDERVDIPLTSSRWGSTSPGRSG